MNKRRIYMVQIDFNEAEKIRNRYPETHIRRTAHKYYVEETPRVMMLLGRYTNTRGNARHAGKAKRRK